MLQGYIEKYKFMYEKCVTQFWCIYQGTNTSFRNWISNIARYANVRVHNVKHMDISGRLRMKEPNASGLLLYNSQGKTLD